ncbi:hypothetical protein GCM10017667_49280 [Streptomyces filamentosus]|uniref:Uncharacterized protein n=1 Tax=Streptomyces filamentosus TaxID=67294 RepID=A0A919BSI6_STRFL|nr:hypothetical protein GCM10017667_49280 [Streptomyces filamentosus]
MAAAGPSRPSVRPAPPPDLRPGETAELAARLGRLFGRLRTLDLAGVAPAPVFRPAAAPSPAAPGAFVAAL